MKEDLESCGPRGEGWTPCSGQPSELGHPLGRREQRGQRRPAPPRTTFLIDFNGVEGDGSHMSLLAHADGPADLGDVVILHDGDGNHCQAFVAEIKDNGLVRLVPDMDTWETTGARLA